MGRRIVAGVAAVVLGTVGLAGCYDPDHRILYSLAPDRSDPKPLDGATVTGPIYVFHDRGHDAATAAVSFFVDLEPVRTDREAPFDLAGGTAAAASPFDPRTLRPGRHVVGVRIDRRRGEPLTFGATFTVAAGRGTTAGPTTAPPGPAPVPPPPEAATRTLSGAVGLDTLTVRAGETLRFDPDRDTTVEMTGNLVVEGRLEMKPAHAGVQHTLRFVGIDEDAFVGGGTGPVPSDVGLWVVGAGQLDVAGAPKTAWTRLAGDAPAGATTITLVSAPSGWRAGDELAVAPTRPGDHTGFDVVRVRSVAGPVVTLDRALARPHPQVGGTWAAEVLNLTRNVHVSGTGTGGPGSTSNGRTHVFVRSTRPQSIRYATFRLVGPRPSHFSTERPIGAEQVFPSPMDTTGRYGLHFHHNHDGSRGTVVEGTVVRDAGNHAYVPHMSNGITFRDTISFDTMHDAYWWDGPTCPPPCDLGNHRRYAREADLTDDLVIDGAVAAKVRPGSDVFRLSAFELGRGRGNVIRDSVAVGVEAMPQSNGFEWPEGHEGLWTFAGNLAHNNARNGVLVWQNTDAPHVIRNVTAYHNEVGIAHGAYTNDFLVEGGTLYGNARTGVLLEAVSKTSRLLRFEDLVIDGGGRGASAVETRPHRASRTNPTVFRGVVMRGFTGPAAVVFASGREHTDRVDLLEPAITGNELVVQSLAPGSLIRIRHGTAAVEVTPASRPGAVWVERWRAHALAVPPFG